MDASERASPERVVEKITPQAEMRRGPRFASPKFTAPKVGLQPVHRSRLMEQLDSGEQTRLTLVVAPAGAGKTVLLTDWLRTRPRRASAWLSCDVADGDPARFAAALIESLRRGSGEPALGEDARQLLDVDGEVSADVIAALSDDVERLGVPQVVVVDDFQLTGRGGTDVVTWLLEYRPANLQVVLASRVDPSLRLHRLRANRELLELRMLDLSFSAEEAGLLLSRFGVQLSEPEVAAVQRRSEGWAAGLQMAAISLQQRSDGGSHARLVDLNRHTVAGYFLEEVLYRQPERVVQFMLATSILEELSVSACTAVCGPGAGDTLERVYRDHLFVSMVDEAAGTYRYHQLIKEVLQAELRARHPDRERQLHETAARHLAEIGRAGAAARHMLHAGDPVTAFRLLDEGVLVDYGTNPTLASALEGIQPDDFAGDPEVLVPLAAELLLRGGFGQGSRTFELAVAAGAEALSQPSLAFRFAVVGAMYHHFRGEEEEALAYRDRAHGLRSRTTGSEDWLVSLDATGAYSHLNLGALDEALRLVEAISAAEASRTPAREVFCLGVRSEVVCARGALSEADEWASRALDLADRFGFARHHSAFLSLRTKALLALERRDLATAAELTERRLDVDRPFLNFFAQLDRAHIWAAGGNLEGALASLPAARKALHSDHSSLLAHADELDARIRLALGDTVGATTIAARLPDDRRNVITAMIHLRTGRSERAQAALDALSGQRVTIRSQVELHLLHAEAALVRRAHQAPRLVREVLDLVEHHGFIQTVLDTAPQLLEHLMGEWDRYPRTEHLAALVAATAEARRQQPTRAQPDELPDPLTEAEIRVLRRLSERLTYGDIAADLHLSLNTVKTHLRRCYMKLGVTSRSAAINRAVSLGLL